MGLLQARQLLCQHVRDRDYHADILAGTGFLTIPVQDALMAVHAALGSGALRDIGDERQRQISAEGWTLAYDDEHDEGALAKAAVAYVSHASVALSLLQSLKPGEILKDGAYQASPPPKYWPWDRKWWKPKDPRRDLVKAGALIVAEIERIDRAEELNRLRAG